MPPFDRSDMNDTDTAVLRKPTAQLLYLLESHSDRSSVRSIPLNHDAPPQPQQPQQAEDTPSPPRKRADSFASSTSSTSLTHPTLPQHTVKHSNEPLSPPPSLPTETPVAAAAAVAMTPLSRIDTEDDQPPSSPPPAWSAQDEEARLVEVVVVVGDGEKEKRKEKQPEEKEDEEADARDKKLTLRDVEQCPLCFHIPNRAKLLKCCGNRVVCSLCARGWLRKSDSCPFCRSHIPYKTRKHGLPDAVELQALIDTLDVVCPYAQGGCPWIGARRDVKDHLTMECVVAIGALRFFVFTFSFSATILTRFFWGGSADPETGEQAAGLIRISDFCLDERWTNTPERTAADSDSGTRTPPSAEEDDGALRPNRNRYHDGPRHVHLTLPFLTSGGSGGAGSSSDAAGGQRFDNTDASSARRLTASAARLEAGGESEVERDGASTVVVAEGSAWERTGAMARLFFFPLVVSFVLVVATVAYFGARGRF
ncbi:hypothetical protein HDU96_001861 [Phlyctochytrium bullatum]|nr:hypothetical protein HDU96_001861 [Phlyctochytrium bullatum]